MTNEDIKKVIQENDFVICGFGESYDAKVVKGTKLWETMAEMLFGTIVDAPVEQLQAYSDDLYDPEQWWRNDDKIDMWEMDVGETDHIRIMRVTEISV